MREFADSRSLPAEYERSAIIDINFNGNILAGKIRSFNVKSAGPPVASIRVLIRVFNVFKRSDSFHSRRFGRAEIFIDNREERIFVENLQIGDIHTFVRIDADIVYPVSQTAKVDNDISPFICRKRGNLISFQRAIINIIIKRPTAAFLNGIHPIDAVIDRRRIVKFCFQHRNFAFRNKS